MSCVVDGVAMKGSSEELAPKTPEELGDALRELARVRESALLVGGGSRLELGNVPARSCCVLSLRELGGIASLEAEDGVVRVGAGTPLALLRDACRAAGWELPLPVPNERATVGGAIATGALAGRSLGRGPARDAVLGLDVVLASGERTKCGGRVVKNVTGYDLGRLYTGSFGRLAVLTSAWLRLRAPAEATAAFRVRLAEGTRPSAFAAALEVSRRETALAAMLVEGPGSTQRLEVELAGDAASLREDRRWLESGLGAGAVEEMDGDASSLESLDARRGGSNADDPGAGGRVEHCARVRLTGAPSQLAPAFDALVVAGAEVAAHPGLGVLVAASNDSVGLVANVDALRAEHGVGAFFERLPLEHKRERDVFAIGGHELAITRALVERFDPDGLLNPGRFAGRL